MGNLAVHGRNQRVVASVRLPWLVSGDVPARLIDAEGREADGPIAQRIEEELAVAVAAAGLRNPQGIVRTEISFDHLLINRRVVGVDVGADHIDSRSQRLPQSKNLAHRAAAGVSDARRINLPLRQRRHRVVNPHVDVVRNRQLRFAGRGNLVDVFSLIVDLKNLIGICAEDLAPFSRFLVGCGQQISRNRTGKLLIRFGGVVSHTADVARLVLHLDQQNRVLFTINLPQMARECHKSRLVRFKVVARVG